MNISIFGSGNVATKLTKLFEGCGYDTVMCAREKRDDLISFDEGAMIGDIIVLAVPYTALADILSGVADKLVGKLVIDASNPLNDDWSPLLLGQETSAGEEVAKLLPESKVVKAFNTIFADVMSKECHDRAGQNITAFVAGDDSVAKTKLMDILEKMEFSPLDVGPLSMARYLEAMAHLNIQIAVGQGGGTNAAFVYHQEK